MKIPPLLLLALALVAPVWAGPNEALAAALADARSLPPGVRPYTRYLAFYDVVDTEKGKERVNFLKAKTFHVHSLSREAHLNPLRLVAPDLIAVNVKDYRWDKAVYAHVATVDPYFHVVEDGELKAAPWLNADQIGELMVLTESVAPLLLANHFINQTATQRQREGHGYYDFLGLGKKEADFQKLVGANVEVSKERRREIAAVVSKSVVTLNNRSMERFAAVGGYYWRTQDFKTNTLKQNTLRLLDGDTEPPKGDASEQYGTLPNGLLTFWLQNGKGERQDVAPPDIASDDKSRNPNRQVEIGLSCIRCHVEGIRPIDDWARATYQIDPKKGGVGLGSPDYDKHLRLQQLYLSDLKGQVKEDQFQYGRALLACNGLTSAENAANYARVYSNYQDKNYTLADLGLLTGYKPEVMLAAFKNYGRAASRGGAGQLDPLLATYTAPKPGTLRVEHVEEVIPIVHQIMRGYVTP